jgi:hypothetical protein
MAHQCRSKQLQNLQPGQTKSGIRQHKGTPAGLLPKLAADPGQLAQRGGTGEGVEGGQGTGAW